jgi:hypothetical protein
MKLSTGVLFFGLSFTLLMVGCESTTRDAQILAEDSFDKALNTPNTEYIDPDRLADNKEDALRQAQSMPRETAPAVTSTKGASPGSTYNGTIMLVNPNKNFAVIDFGTGSVPPGGTELSVYRGGRMIGAIKITEPVKAPLASADIVNGTLASGDLVLK